MPYNHAEKNLLNDFKQFTSTNIIHIVDSMQNKKIIFYIFDKDNLNLDYNKL